MEREARVAAQACMALLEAVYAGRMREAKGRVMARVSCWALGLRNESLGRLNQCYERAPRAPRPAQAQRG
jgi:hypothetical protein